MSPEEIESIKAVQQGQKDEFRLLVSLYKNLVFSLIMRMVRNHTIAEDLSQEVFIRAYKSINTFRFESEFSTWLRRIAINHTNSYFSSKNYKKQKLTNSDDFDLHSSDRNQEEQKIEKEKISFLMECLSLIKDKFKNALILSAFEDLSYEEVAKAESVPIGTVRSRINTARVLLLNCLGEKL